MDKKREGKTVFLVLYSLCFIGAALLGLLSNSYFAYQISDYLWTDLLFLFFVAVLYVTAFVQNMLEPKTAKSIALDSAIFLASLLLFILTLFIGNIFYFISVIYSAILLCTLCFFYALEYHNHKKVKTDIKRLISALSLIFIGAINIINIKFVNEMYMAWALIPTSVIACAVVTVGIILLKDVWSEIYKEKWRRILNFILCILIVLFVAFFYSFTALGIANCVFDEKHITAEYIVLEKHVSSGARQFTRHELKVEINGETEWVSVPSSDYYTISEGDIILIDYYSGALNFAYYLYGGKT